MRIMVISPDFPDDTRQAFKDLGHGSNIVRDVQAARNAIRHKNLPELMILDNRVEGASFYATETRSNNPDIELYLVVSSKAMENEPPERMGFNGYIVGELTLEKIFEITGDVYPPPVEEKPELELPPPVVEAITKSSVYTPIDRDGDGHIPDQKPEKTRKSALSRLYFPAILGVLAFGVLLNGLGYFSTSEKPERVLQNLYGASKEQACNLCEADHLPYEIYEADSDQPLDFVISQYPPAGTPLGEVDTVAITVSNNGKATAVDMNKQDGGGGEAPSVPSTSPETNAPAEPTAASTPPAPAPAPAPKATHDQRPVVSVSASRTSGPSSGFMVSLHASAQDPDGGSIVSYSWSCGGSGPSTSCEMVSNVAPASRTITCTVTDDEGSSASASVTITMY